MLIITELETCDSEDVCVRFNEEEITVKEVSNLVLFTERRVEELETNDVVSFSDITMLELFLALVVLSDELGVTDEKRLVVTVLVTNVEFDVGDRTEDCMTDDVLFMEDISIELSTDRVTFLDNATVELFTTNDFVTEDGTKTVAELVKLTNLEDWISVLLENGLDIVELTPMVEELTELTVVFGPTLDAAVVDN